MPPLIVSSLRGGLNEDAPVSLAENQCTVARNVEWALSPLGERRLGAASIDLTGTPFAACDHILWMHRHLPTQDLSESQLWLMGYIGATGAGVLGYRDTSWHSVAMPEPLNATLGNLAWHVNGQTLHGKLFVAYPNDANRLHVFDTGATALRRTGLATVVAQATVASTGSGSFTGNRAYRVRFTRQVGGKTV